MGAGRRISRERLSRREAVLEAFNGLGPLPECVRQLLSPEGFREYFNLICDCYPTRLEAYEALEDIHVRLTGRRKYSEYASFRVANRKCATLQ